MTPTEEDSSTCCRTRRAPRSSSEMHQRVVNRCALYPRMDDKGGRRFGKLAQVRRAGHEDAIISASRRRGSIRAELGRVGRRRRRAKLFRDNLLLFLSEGGDATAAADVRFYVRAKAPTANQQQKALKEAALMYVDACGSGIGQHMRTRSTHAVLGTTRCGACAPERALAGGVSPWDAPPALRGRGRAGDRDRRRSARCPRSSRACGARARDARAALGRGSHGVRLAGRGRRRRPPTTG